MPLERKGLKDLLSFGKLIVEERLPGRNFVREECVDLLAPFNRGERWSHEVWLFYLALLVEPVDTHASEACAERRESSSLSVGISWYEFPLIAETLLVETG